MNTPITYKEYQEALAICNNYLRQDLFSSVTFQLLIAAIFHITACIVVKLYKHNLKN